MEGGEEWREERSGGEERRGKAATKVLQTNQTVWLAKHRLLGVSKVIK